MSMSKLTIDQVKNNFADWRKNKNRQDKIPEELWQQVKILFKYYRHSEVLRQLKITMEQARNKSLLPPVNNIKKISQYIGSEPFVKIPNAQHNVHPAATTTITLQRGETQLLLNHPSEEQVQWIVSSFME